MGSQDSVEQDDGSAEVDLSSAVCSFSTAWCSQPVPSSLAELSARLGGLCLNGLEAMFRHYPGTRGTFFRFTLPFIVRLSGMLPELLPSLRLKKLVQGRQDKLLLERRLVASLLANMFLCVMPDSRRSGSMPSVSFRHLLEEQAPQEVAKLRMFVHYFERIREDPPRGELRIYRQVRDMLPEERRHDAWAASQQPLLEIETVEMHVGFEDVGRGAGCLLADFANRFIGGGVLSGGCVQEEIRFAICPELCASLLVCPCMLEHEAITVVGGEQFSAYQGYAFSLRFGGAFQYKSMPRDTDGTPLVAITAMDALDFRFMDSSLQNQMKLHFELRELEKAAAAFAPVDLAATSLWPIVATGNWGCGVFGGHAPLKAVLQWLAASEGGRRLRYFPFELPIGPELSAMSRALSARGVTVGQLFRALRGLSSRMPPLTSAESLMKAVQEAIVVPLQGAGISGDVAAKAEAKSEAAPKQRAKARSRSSHIPQPESLQADL